MTDHASESIVRLQAAVEALETNPAARWRQRTSRGIAFESALEQEFREYRTRGSLPLTRIAVALGALFYLVFLALERWVGGPLHEQGWIYAIVLGLCLPSNLLLVVLTYQPRALHWIPAVTTFASACNTLGLVMIVVHGHRVAVTVPYEVLGLQLFYNFFLLSLLWRPALMISLLATLALALGLVMADVPADKVFTHTFLLGSMSLVGGICCHLQERYQRQSWIRGRLMQALSEHDGLTGLNNHRVFYQRGADLLRQAKRDRKSVAVVVADVDHFKQFNDRHGHLQGDACLRQVAQALRRLARRPLDLCARLGGEEFALLFYDSDGTAARQRAGELCDAVRGLRGVDGTRVSISCGVAVALPSDPASIESLTGRADRALYAAKDAGRDRVMMDDDA